ncbi:MAG: pyridoxine 5'-phosphate synthase [Saprospiraceae bacterium]|nr:pyridoxine 5'-phosphate synthase [Saprospiraceae bacterium]
MTRLSINVNKVALIRNARGGDFPNLIQVAKDCEAYGGQGITVHPRPDERHIRYSDIPKLKDIVTTEFNIEGNPTPRFMELVLDNPPHQVTLVPDAPDALTSSEGWNTIEHKAFLTEIISRFKAKDIRVSLFLDPDPAMVEGALDVGADRIELYTGHYAEQFTNNKEAAVAPHVVAAQKALDLGLGLNAGHDLNLDNLAYYVTKVPGFLEVSIGHALVCDALYFGLKNTIQMYLSRCQSV